MSLGVGFGGVLVAIIVLGVRRVGGQRVHVVGDNIGWTIPQNDAAAYQTWASNNNFAVGDILCKISHFPSPGYCMHLKMALLLVQLS